MPDFIVVGSRRVCDTAPGDTLAIEDEAHADYLVVAGHIERKQPPTKPAKGDTESE